jgi:hypothetical protein
MKKTFFALLGCIWFFTIGNVSAQTSEEKPEEKKDRAAFALKFSPLSMFDPLSPAFQFAGEYPITPRSSMQTELGLIFGNSLENKNIFGYRVRQEFRYYLSPLSKSAMRGPYIGFDAFYKYQNNGTKDVNFEIDENPDIPGPDYWEMRTVKQLDRVFAFQVRAGAQHVFTDAGSLFNRFVFDWSVGFGIRKIFEMSTQFWDYDENSVRRAYSANVRVGYMLFK